MLNILLIGSGAREHALARAVNASPTPHQLFCFGSSRNPGIMSLCADFTTGSMTDTQAICSFATTHNIDFAIVGPEAPLAVGVVDALATHNIRAIGPTKQLAQLEASKGFTRDLAHKHNIPGQARYERFSRVNHRLPELLAELGEDYVVKADGLCGGKGVKISGEHLHSHDDALAFCQEIDGPFVIEEKLTGPEFSLISLCDGTHLAHCPAVQDHKRAYEGDTGPNTGGMGSYSDANGSLPFLTDDDITQAHAINQATCDALKTEYNQAYCGVLYGGFMKTPAGVKLIEYNARFGDPEAMNILPLLEADFIDVCQHMLSGTLNELDVTFKPQASVCKYIVPEGYPDKPIKGEVLDVSAVTNQDHLYYAAIDAQGDTLMMTGSRAAAVLGVGDTLAEAEREAQTLAEQLQGPVFYRKDIGTAELIATRMTAA
jgi:phosphoribosylamine--glycine ligase